MQKKYHLRRFAHQQYFSKNAKLQKRKEKEK